MIFRFQKIEGGFADHLLHLKAWCQGVDILNTILVIQYHNIIRTVLHQSTETCFTSVQHFLSLFPLGDVPADIGQHQWLPCFRVPNKEDAHFHRNSLTCYIVF